MPFTKHMIVCYHCCEEIIDDCYTTCQEEEDHTDDQRLCAACERRIMTADLNKD